MAETIEQIKQTISEAHEQGIYNWNTATIAALITSIESQEAFFKGYSHQSKIIEERLKKKVESLQKENERIKNAMGEFVEKHFHGGSKANRDDYVALGIPTADISKLREACKVEENTQV